MSSKYAFAKSLREVRFLFCQTSDNSAALRSFLVRAYPTMKKHNPHVPIMLRDASGTLPRLFVRHDHGLEKQQSLEGFTDKQIEDAVTGLVRTPA